MMLQRAFPLSFLALVSLAGCVAPGTEDGDVSFEVDGETTSNLSGGVHIETQSNADPAFGKRRILNRVVAMIEKTPNDGKIFAAIHSVDEAPVADALVAKAKKGATVKVVMNGATRGKDLPEKLRKGLAASPRGAFEYCGQPNGGDGCISNAKDGIMHSKLFLFSATEDENGQARKSVSWMSSANMTTQTGANTFNNAVAIYGDAKLHDAMKDRYFDHLFAKSSVPGTIVSGDSQTVVYASPSADDLVADRLANIEAGAPCNVAISQNMIHFDTRPEIWKEVKRITTFCTVKVLVNHINRESFDRLASAGIEAKYSYTHDKVFLIDAKLNGRPQRVAFTGSHNWTRDAQVSNDELLVRIADPAAYQAMAAHLLRQWAAASKLAPGM
ncbi:MAG: phospholipase D-like domain-containing protein [Labilithrix sp.]